jgi:hypothetical protein
MFISLGFELYKNDKFSPFGSKTATKKEIKNWLTGQHNFSFLIQKNIIVLKENVPITRGVAFINTLGNFGTIGVFESFNDTKAVNLLVEKSAEFFKNNGITRILAPMNGSIWSDYRFMTKGFEDKPFLGEVYNKPYYESLFENCGFTVAKRWTSTFVDDLNSFPENVKRITKPASLDYSGLNIRQIENFDNDILLLHKLIMNSFSGFYAFTPLTEEEFVKKYSVLKKVYDKKAIRLVFDKSNPDELLSAALAFPNFQTPLDYIRKTADSYIFLYLATLQKDGVSVNPRASAAACSTVGLELLNRKKGCVCALMSDTARSLTLMPKFDRTHEYVLMEKIL